MRIITILLLAVCAQVATAKDYWLAPGGTGNGRSIDAPMGDAKRAIENLKAGDVLYVRGGTY